MFDQQPRGALQLHCRSRAVHCRSIAAAADAPEPECLKCGAWCLLESQASDRGAQAAQVAAHPAHGSRHRDASALHEAGAVSPLQLIQAVRHLPIQTQADQEKTTWVSTCAGRSRGRP